MQRKQNSQSTCFLFGPMISRLVALATALPIGEPAMTCLADSTRSITLISVLQKRLFLRTLHTRQKRKANSGKMRASAVQDTAVSQGDNVHHKSLLSNNYVWGKGQYQGYAGDE